MAYSQVAKLFLRGSLVRKILKNLNADQVEEINQIVEQVFNEPGLQACRTEFCNALARTIRNEYTNPEIGLQDYRIALMRAAIAAKHGHGTKPPSPQAITDPIQRKKWFQTWAFNFLKQILRENKLPTLTKKQKITVPADQAALHHIGEALRTTIQKQHDYRYKQKLNTILDNLEIIQTKNSYLLKFDHWPFPITLIDEIRQLGITYFKLGISIVQTEEGVKVERLTQEIPNVTVVNEQKHIIKMTSFDNDDTEQSNYRNSLEQSAITQKTKEPPMELELPEAITTLQKQLPQDARPVFEILYEQTRPQKYIDQYGGSSPKISHMSKFLKITPRDVKKRMTTIRHMCLALGVGT